MKNYFFSVVTINLNNLSGVKKTVKSLKKQTFYNYEHIIIDGKSIDGSQKYLKDNKFFFNKLIISNDKGIYDAMNKGIQISSGKWLIFMNSGDVFFNKNSLKNISNHIKKNIGDVFYGDVILKYKTFEIKKKSNFFFENSIEMPFCHQSSVTKKKLLVNNKFDLNFKIASDFDFFYKLFFKKKVFVKLHFPLSKVEIGGTAYKKRISTIIENYKIKKKYNKQNYFSFFKLLIFTLFSYYLKKMIPEILLNIILKKRYDNSWS